VPLPSRLGRPGTFTSSREQVKLSGVLDLHLESRLCRRDHSHRGSTDNDFLQLVPLIPRVDESGLHSEWHVSDLGTGFSGSFSHEQSTPSNMVSQPHARRWHRVQRTAHITFPCAPRSSEGVLSLEARAFVDPPPPPPNIRAQAS